MVTRVTSALRGAPGRGRIRGQSSSPSRVTILRVAARSTPASYIVDSSCGRCGARALSPRPFTNSRIYLAPPRTWQRLISPTRSAPSRYASVKAAQNNTSALLMRSAQHHRHEDRSRVPRAERGTEAPMPAAYAQVGAYPANAAVADGLHQAPESAPLGPKQSCVIELQSSYVAA